MPLPFHEVKGRATAKQVQCLAILMTKYFGDHRKGILKANLNIDSTKDIDFDTASVWIDAMMKDDFDFMQTLINQYEQTIQVSLLHKEEQTHNQQ